MQNVLLTALLREEYDTLFRKCQPLPAKQAAIEQVVDRIVLNKSRYQDVGSPLQIPWYFIATIHHMEASLNFHTHLHNGDPLTAVTVHVPKGRPKAGTPPFTWEFSANDALTLEGLNSVTDWTIPGLLYQLEKYNGFGYRTNHPEVLSPYLWSASNNYTKGKFVEDGKFDPDAVSSQLGAAVVIRRMAERQLIRFDADGNPLLGNEPEPTIEDLEPLVSFSKTEASPDAATLQIAMDRFPGIFLKVDGIPGDRTSDAFKRVTGHFLAGDPRG